MPLPDSIRSLIGISIVTRNRWDDLEFTLSRLQRDGLDCLRTIVGDDASDVSHAAALQAKFPWVEFIRSETSGGPTARRNQIARLLTTPLILELDDDSFPVSGDLVAAAAWLMAEPNAFLLAFPIVSEEPKTPPVSTTPAEPILAKAFVACGCLMKRDIFLEIGGYEEFLFIYFEEEELAMKAFQRGYFTYLYPGMTVWHRLTKISRSNGRTARMMVRNYMLLCLWYFPFPTSWARALRYGAVQVVRSPLFRPFGKDVLLGYFDGISSYFSHHAKKRRCTREEFLTWEDLRGSVYRKTHSAPAIKAP